jgi:hypothetical protein
MKTAFEKGRFFLWRYPSGRAFRAARQLAAIPNAVFAKAHCAAMFVHAIGNCRHRPFLLAG